MAKAKRNKVLYSLYLEPAQVDKLEDLATRTRITKAVLLREAVDDLFTKHGLNKPPKRGRS